MSICHDKGVMLRWDISNYMLEIDLLRIYIWVSWGVIFEGFGCPNDTQPPCWPRLLTAMFTCMIWGISTSQHITAHSSLTFLMKLYRLKHTQENTWKRTVDQELLTTLLHLFRKLLLSRVSYTFQNIVHAFCVVCICKKRFCICLKHPKKGWQTPFSLLKKVYCYDTWKRSVNQDIAKNSSSKFLNHS